MIIRRNRTPSKYIYYALYLYFSGLSLRKASKILSLYFIKGSHVLVWNWIQKHNPKKLSSKRKKISEFVINETLIKVASEYIWLWVTIEPKNKQILALSISKERNMFVAERFLLTVVKEYGKYPVSTEGGTCIHKPVGS